MARSQREEESAFDLMLSAAARGISNILFVSSSRALTSLVAAQGSIEQRSIDLV